MWQRPADWAILFFRKKLKNYTRTCRAGPLCRRVRIIVRIRTCFLCRFGIRNIFNVLFGNSDSWFCFGRWRRRSRCRDHRWNRCGWVSMLLLLFKFVLTDQAFLQWMGTIRRDRCCRWCRWWDRWSHRWWSIATDVGLQRIDRWTSEIRWMITAVRLWWVVGVIRRWC